MVDRMGTGSKRQEPRRPEPLSAQVGLLPHVVGASQLCREPNFVPECEHLNP